ncbi:MAG: hypothetical protein EXR28_15190 [Betaproteobacteria bacterium]|nr:hypothetical protein [Betaproteobacteria bacterium]
MQTKHRGLLHVRSFFESLAFWRSLHGKFRTGIVACGLALISSTAAAQSYPTKPIRMIIPYAPGGPVDGVGRVLVQSLNKTWGHPVVIENRGGAAGNIGTEAVVKASPDGYTLLFTASGPLVINQALYGNLPYDPMKDFAPVTIAYSTPNMLIVSAKRMPCCSGGLSWSTRS